MKLFYKKFFLKLRFETPIRFDVEPLFIMRSVLGRQLRSLCCIAHGRACADCEYNRDCVYSLIFETIMAKDNIPVPGRDRASHPWVLACADTGGGELYELGFYLTLLGSYVHYLPYLYGAFERAGRAGILKARIPFSIAQIACEEQGALIPLLYDGCLEMEGLSPSFWEAGRAEGELSDHEVRVELISPLRFKSGGRYTSEFDAGAFINCLHRRAHVLCSLYGEGGGERADGAKERLRLSRRDLVWTDAKHYSARQKRVFALGGVKGAFTLSGSFSPYELSLLEAARLFNAGKNTNFGLGQLDYWIR